MYYSIKTVLWFIIAILFGVFSLYSYIISNKYENIKEEIKKQSVSLTSSGDHVFGWNYDGVLNSLYDMVKSLYFIGLLGFILSAIAAILSILI